MYTYAYIPVYTGKYMSGQVQRPRLYWRYKKDGKWTWKPAENKFCECKIPCLVYCIQDPPLEEEE